MRPKISIIIPAYNAERYLAEALESALSQTLPPTEIIVLDDGSQDGTGEVARSFPPPVRYVRFEHRGLPAVRNAGFAMSVGDYVVNLDADDRLDPKFLEKTFALLSQQADPQIAYCYTQCRFFGSIDRVTRFPQFDTTLLPIRNFVPATTLLRGEIARRFRYREKLLYHEDYDYYMQMLAAGYRGVLLDEPLLLYRQHDANRTLHTKTWLAHVRFVEYLIRTYPSLYPPEVAQKARERAREKTFLGFIESRRQPLTRRMRFKQWVWMISHYPRHIESWRHLRCLQHP
ncbi:MAG: glycosyltransferase family 2 protein [Kiritimatiellae bacterium]|nr:glycosyltransferase family 2 protein [Kiritimatiellia bacterium]MDW8459275.1 glycosyltransferase family 2 protein [Verrucomicrobiota bacterium]